jgi:hypothetical protein
MANIICGVKFCEAERDIKEESGVVDTTDQRSRGLRRMDI